MTLSQLALLPKGRVPDKLSLAYSKAHFRTGYKRSKKADMTIIINIFSYYPKISETRKPRSNQGFNDI